jgi:peptidyl-prolyl cis-trans isomerase-like protein 2
VMRKLKKKGYVRLETNHGAVTLELHCDIAPRTCTNFLGLCESAKYNNTKFHRLIKEFMLQGGRDPDDENCLWGGAFKDEFDDRLHHDKPYILSMANAGKDTNRRQFFITFKSCQHLDRKHSIFGSVIQGMEILSKMEGIPTDKNDCPTQDITIVQTVILENPAEEARILEQKRLQALSDARQKPKTVKPQPKPAGSPKQQKNEVGRYLKDKLKKAAKADEEEAGDTPVIAKPPPSKSKKKSTFGNFSGW